MALPIRLRLTLFYGGLLFLALVLSGAGVVTLLRYRLTIQLDETLDRRLQGVENFLIRETSISTEGKIPSELAEYASTQPEGHLIQVEDASGHVILKSGTAPYASRVQTRDFMIYGHLYRTRALGSIQYVEDSVREIAILLLWSTPFLLLLIGLSGYWISSRLLRQVDEVTVAARSISAKDLSARLAVPDSRDEISRLTSGWNEMLARLEESFTRMQRFTADAAHELRTPLASLRTTAQLSLRRPREAVDYQQALQQIVEISDQMQKLTESLLQVARGDSAAPQISPVPFDFREAVEELTATMQPLFDDAKLTLSLHLPAGPLEVTADSDGVRRIIASLLDNAIKYTPAGGEVKLTASDGGDDVKVEVADNGVGIPQESLPHIFDRFYRVDSSRDRRTGGYGLGLAIAYQIALAHGGELTARSELGHGSTFVFVLPKLRGSGDYNSS